MHAEIIISVTINREESEMKKTGWGAGLDVEKLFLLLLLVWLRKPGMTTERSSPSKK
jgi:hypothetical protein